MGLTMNDVEATGKQVAEELKNLAEGLVPLVIVTLACVISMAIMEATDGGKGRQE
jgi:hypothetical protein